MFIAFHKPFNRENSTATSLPWVFIFSNTTYKGLAVGRAGLLGSSAAGEKGAAAEKDLKTEKQGTSPVLQRGGKGVGGKVGRILVCPQRDLMEWLRDSCV